MPSAIERFVATGPVHTVTAWSAAGAAPTLYSVSPIAAQYTLNA